MRQISKLEWPFYKVYTKIKWAGPWGRKRRGKLEADLSALRTRLIGQVENDVR